MHVRRIWLLVGILSVGASLFAAIPSAKADPPAMPTFHRTWERTDYPVADGAIARTWMWGPEAFTPQGQEIYDGSSGWVADRPVLRQVSHGDH